MTVKDMHRSKVLAPRHGSVIGTEEMTAFLADGSCGFYRRLRAA